MTTFILKFSEVELQLLIEGLNELPRKHSQPLLEKMQAQINEQLKPKESPVKRGRKPKLKVVPQEQQSEAG